MKGGLFGFMVQALILECLALSNTTFSPPISSIAPAGLDEEQKQRLGYLVDLYKLYHGHINTMFNYFLILAGLIATAYVQSINTTAQISKTVSACIGTFGALMSYISLRIHIRSRDMIDIIEEGLRQEEERMFKRGGGFLIADKKQPSWLGRHKYQFPITYWAFVLAFLLMAANACPIGSSDIGQALSKFRTNWLSN